MKQIIWLKISLLAILIGCVPSIQPEMPPQGIRPKTELNTERLTSAFGSGQLIREQEGNCLVDEIEIPGQGSRAQGFINGLAIAPNPVDSNDVSIPTFEPFAVGSEMFATAAVPSPSEPAAIIIVDDFNGNDDLDQPGVYFLDQQRGPTLADLTGSATEAEVTALEDAGQYSHGALVFNHTLALLSAGDPSPRQADFVVNLPAEDTEINVTAFVFTKPNVIVAALDTQDFNTEIIGSRLQATTQTLAERQIRRFAVNLSFGLVPCSVLADIEAGTEKRPDLTFEKYRDEVLNASGLDANQFRDDLVNVLTTPINVTGDPLLTGAETNPERFANAAVSDITYLAASGNYALPYSLYPGYWSEFVSTSAHNLADTTTRAVRDPDYSNTGEVLMPGGYFTLTAYDPNTGDFRTYDEISIGGTSFAAPVLSVFTALEFTEATPRCALIPPNITSPMAFFRTDPPVALPIPDLNIALADALSRYCP